MTRATSPARLELSERLTYWTAPHPQWQPNADWPQEVGCVLYVGTDALVLIDPLIRDDIEPNAWAWLDDAAATARLPVVVLLTAPWHERSTRAVVERLGAQVWADPKALQRLAGLPQLETIPAGVAVFAPSGVDEGQVAFLVEDEKTLVVGELFVGAAAGLRLTPSPATTDLNGFVTSLDELRRLPVERVLVSHGDPVLSGGSEAIAAALQGFRR
jgi:glyoxylase-like metal-dependent hydrolase (beta-lactamase superfamily II)